MSRPNRKRTTEEEIKHLQKKIQRKTLELEKKTGTLERPRSPGTAFLISGEYQSEDSSASFSSSDSEDGPIALKETPVPIISPSAHKDRQPRTDRRPEPPAGFDAKKAHSSTSKQRSNRDAVEAQRPNVSPLYTENKTPVRIIPQSAHKERQARPDRREESPVRSDAKKAHSSTRKPRSNRDAVEAQTSNVSPLYTENETPVRIIPQSAHKERRARSDRREEASARFDGKKAHSSTRKPRSDRDTMEAQSSNVSPHYTENETPFHIIPQSAHKERQARPERREEPPARFDAKKAHSSTSKPRSNRDAVEAQSSNVSPHYTENETPVHIIPQSAHKERQARPDRREESPARFDVKKAHSSTSKPRSNRDAVEAQSSNVSPLYTENETPVPIIPQSAHKDRQARPDRRDESPARCDAKKAHSSASDLRTNRDAVEGQKSMSTPRLSLTISKTNNSWRIPIKHQLSSGVLEVNHLGNDPRASPKASQANNLHELERNDELNSSRNELAYNTRFNPRRISETLQADNSDNNQVLDRSTELLNALSDDLLLTGEDIQPELVQQWTPILKKGLAENVAEAIQKRYAIPGNCKLLKAPTLNEEFDFDDHAKYRDQKLQRKQEQLGLALTAIGIGITVLLDGAAAGGDKYLVNAMMHLRAGCYLLADLHFDQTKTRRTLCCSGNSEMKKFLVERLSKTTHGMPRTNFSGIDTYIDRDDTLFGQKVGKMVKKHFNSQTTEPPRPSSSSHGVPARKSRGE